MAKRTKTLIKQHLEARDRGKAHYQRAEELLNEVLERMDSGTLVDLGDGQHAQLIDNFREKNKVFRAHGIARYEIKVSRGADVKA